MRIDTFFEEAWKDIFIGEVRCIDVEHWKKGRINSYGNHSVGHLEPASIIRETHFPTPKGT